MNSFEITKSVKMVLDSMHIYYEYNPETNIIRFEHATQSKLKQLTIVIAIRDTDFIVFSMSPIDADEESRNEVSRYLNMINAQRLMGCYYIDCDSAKIVWRDYIDCTDLPSIPVNIIQRALIMPLLQYDIFGDGLAALLMGFSDAETEFEKANKKME